MGAAGKAKQGGGVPKLGVPSWGPRNQDIENFVSILGSPYLGKLPHALAQVTEVCLWGFALFSSEFNDEIKSQVTSP